jgi:hypothetical protein
MTPAYYDDLRAQLRRLESAIAEVNAEKRPLRRKRGALLLALQEKRDEIRASVAGERAGPGKRD